MDSLEDSLGRKSSDSNFHFPPRSMPTIGLPYVHKQHPALDRIHPYSTPPPKMALRDEQADILGGPILQRPESGLFTSLSRYRSVFESVALLGLGLLMCIVCVRGLEHLKKHRELRYKKAMRRKHGIPDSDCRPFAVAYAAAKRAHLEREAQDRKKTTNCVSDHSLPVVDQRTDAQKDAHGLRKRVPETSLQVHGYQLPGKYATAYGNKRPEPHSSDFLDRYNPNPRRQVTVPESSSVEKPLVHRPSRKSLIINIGNNEESRKRSFEDEVDIKHETIKKSRIDGRELIDGDEQADWYHQQGDLSPPRRLSREFLGRLPASNFGYTDGRERSRRVINDSDEPLEETMEDIVEGEVMEFKAVICGKKRGRAEAGSTFGGDDDDDAQNGKVPHHRKRRTVSRRRMEVPARGQKRDREAESPEGEGSETSRAQRSSKKKRGKRAMADDVSKMSVEDPCVSKDPLCGGHKVGDEWEVDGVQHKVGNNGERLRLALVKKARNKYHMPQDSQHPDRLAALEIYVETWMTDEQYKQAEGREGLAWQEGQRGSSGSKAIDVPDSPTKSGKSILWDSIKGSPARRPFRQSVPPSASSRINPFEQRQLQPALGRRVASSSTIASPILPGVADSPTRPGYRGFSKWEKQDREAEALARIRAKIEDQKKDQVSSGKPAEIPATVTALELGAKPLSVPTITITPAPVVAAGRDSNNSVPQSKSDTSTSFATPLSISDSVKGASTTVSAPATGILLASTPIPAAPSIFFPIVPAAPATTSAAPPSPFSPSVPPAPTSAIALSSVGPNPFEKGIVAGMTSASTPSSSTPGPTTQPQLPPMESTSKPILSSFTKPDTASTSTVTIPPTTRLQTPSFGDSSSSSSSPVTFGSPLATAKAEVLVRPPISTSATMFESSKPTAPLFSFSSTSPSSSAATHPTLSAPKFSFGQPSTTSTFTPSSNLQPKPAFKFGQASPGSTDSDSASTVPAAGASKKPAAPVSIFDTTTGSNEPVRPSAFGTTTPFGSSTPDLISAASADFSGKSVAVDGGSSTPAPPRSTSGSVNTTIPNNALSPTPVGAPTSGNISVFSFSGMNSSPKRAEGTKPTSLFGGGAGGSSPVPNFSGSSAENKPAFGFNASVDGSNSISTLGGITGGSKPPVFRGSAENSKPMFTFSGAVEGSKSTFASGRVTGHRPAPDAASENAKPFNALDIPKPTSTLGTTTAGPSSSPLTFAFGKNEATADTSTGTQPKPTATFTFGAPSGAVNSMFGKPSAPLASGDSSQLIFGKPTPSAFGFTGTGGSNSSSTFTFGKPAAQNQKQEQ